MNKKRVFAMAAVMSAAMAVPAMADYVRLGSVDVGYQTDRDTSFVRFGGGLEGLKLTATSSDIQCRNIAVTYNNGRRDSVFSGVLSQNRPVMVDLAGGTRRVTRIDFNCRSDRFRGGQITINGDVGRFRNDWHNDPYWAGQWTSVFGAWNNGPSNSGWDNGVRANGWVTIGRERFEGGRDGESTLAGWGGRRVDRIGLRPLESNATCRRVVAVLADGRVVDLRAPAYLERGRIKSFDLPGGLQNVAQVKMQCRSDSRYAVNIEVFARK